MNTVSPIIIFVYNRLDHTKKTLDSLKKNHLASKSELFIYSDAEKNKESKQKVTEIRKYLKTITGFKKITIIERNENWGLANSIIDGVTNIVNKYGAVIVLEDDMVTSPYFLTYMNEALKFYQNETKVWHISGWNYPIATDELDDAFFWRVMNCWGWATWSDRWSSFEKNSEKLIENWDINTIKRFNLDGSEPGFWKQIQANQNKKLDTWAIFWYATIFEKNGLCLNPSLSLVVNIGLDGSGEHCSESSIFNTNLQDTQRVIKLPISIVESELALKLINNFYKSIKKPFYKKIIYKITNQFKW